MYLCRKAEGMTEGYHGCLQAATVSASRLRNDINFSLDVAARCPHGRRNTLIVMAKPESSTKARHMLQTNPF